MTHGGVGPPHPPGGGGGGGVIFLVTPHKALPVGCFPGLRPKMLWGFAIENGRKSLEFTVGIRRGLGEWVNRLGACGASMGRRSGIRLFCASLG